MASADSSSVVARPTAPTLTRGFLFSDLRGYTAFVEAHGAAAGAVLLDRYRRLVRAAVALHDGAEIKTEGDSFYVVFSSVSGAVACALQIVRDTAYEERDEATPAISVGVGVNAGETIETAEGYVGTAVNLAARLCSAAAAGEVLVSQTVRDLTANTAGVRFEPAGRRRLKGIAEPVPVFRAAPADSATARRHVRRYPIRPLALGAVAVVVAVVAIASLTFGGLLRQSASSGSSPSTRNRPSASVVPVTDIVIPPFVEGSPEPTPVELVSGTYRLTAFRPRFTFTITQPGWSATEDLPDTFTLSSGRGYLTGALIQVVSNGPCVNSPTRLLDQTPHALVKWLQSTPYVKVSDPRPVIIGGYTGLSVEISQAAPPDACPGGGLAGRDVLFQVGEHTFFLAPDEHVLVVALDVGDRPVTLLVGSVDQRNYKQTVDAAQAIIGTVQIAP